MQVKFNLRFLQILDMQQQISIRNLQTAGLSNAAFSLTEDQNGKLGTKIKQDILNDVQDSIVDAPIDGKVMDAKIVIGKRYP